MYICATDQFAPEKAACICATDQFAPESLQTLNQAGLEVEPELSNHEQQPAPPPKNRRAPMRAHLLGLSEP